MPDPDLSITPLAYTTAEGQRFQPWDNPPIRTAHAILWEDGQRWDAYNRQTEKWHSESFIADLKESFRAEAADEHWWCDVHNQTAPCVIRGKHVCSPASDKQPRGVPCSASIRAKQAEPSREA